MGTDHAFWYSHVIFYLTVLSYCCQAFDSYVATDRTAPWDDCLVNEGEVSNRCVSNNAAVRQSHSFPNFASWTDWYVWPYLAIRTNAWWLMDWNVAIFLIRMSIDFEVVKESSLSLDIVCRFSNIKPEVVFDGQRVELTFLSHLGVYFCLNHTKSFRHSVQDRSVEHIYTSINMISNKLFWLFDESLNFSWVLFIDYDSESWRVFNLSQENRPFLAMTFMKFKQFFKRVTTNDIAIEHEENSIFVSLL